MRPRPSTTVASGVSDELAASVLRPRPTKTMRPSNRGDRRPASARRCRPGRAPPRGAAPAQVATRSASSMRKSAGITPVTPQLLQRGVSATTRPRARACSREVVAAGDGRGPGRGRSSARARMSMSSALAAPSTGAAAMRTRRASSRVPATPAFEARGTTRTASSQVTVRLRRIACERASQSCECSRHRRARRRGRAPASRPAWAGAAETFSSRCLASWSRRKVSVFCSVVTRPSRPSSTSRRFMRSPSISRCTSSSRACDFCSEQVGAAFGLAHDPRGFVLGAVLDVVGQLLRGEQRVAQVASPGRDAR